MCIRDRVLIGIAIFLTLFTMSPVMEEINTTAYEPYKNEEITQEEFIDTAVSYTHLDVYKRQDNDGSFDHQC